MVPDYKPTIPEWFHQRFVLGNFLAETQAHLEYEEKEATSRRYVMATATCWLVAALVLLATAGVIPSEPKEPLATQGTSQPFIPTPPAVVEPSISSVEPQDVIALLLPESDEMKRVLNQLGVIEVQGSFYTVAGEPYKGPLQVRKVMSSEVPYLTDVVLYEIDGPFRLRLPADSTVYIYAPIKGLDWNGFWGTPIQTPSSEHCSQPCVLRFEDLIFASSGFAQS